MRYNLIASFILSIAPLVLVGCATGGPAGKNSSKEYTRGTTPLALNSKKVTSNSCRNLQNKKKMPWKKLLPVANSCVKSKWSKLEDLGNHLSVTASQAPWGPYYLSLVAESKKNYAKSLWMIELAIKKAPRLGILHYQKGRVLWTIKSSSASIAEISNAVKYDPNLIEAHVFLGQVYFRSQKMGLATRHLEAVLVADRSHFVALSRLGLIRKDQGDGDEAVDLLKRAATVNPDDLNVRRALAQAYEELQGDMNLALDEYKVVRRISSQLSKQQKLALDLKINELKKVVSESTPKVTMRQPASNGGMSE